MSEHLPPSYEFGPFQLDPEWPRLLRDGQTIPVTPKALEVLLVLVKAGGQTVHKEQLIREVWPDTFIEEGNLSVHIFALRKALGEHGGQSYIETVPRRGYRFSAPVREGVREQTFLVERQSSKVVVVEQIETEDSIEPISVVPTPLALPPKRAHIPRFYLVIIGTLLLTGLLVYLVAFRTQKRTRPNVALRSIAILPFRSLDGSEANENYLGVGIADAVITRLGTLDELRVRPTSAVLRYDEETQNSLTAARSLGVDAVIEGKYQCQGERIRVTVQLVGVHDGMQLWSATFDEKFDDLFTTLDSISTELSRELLSGLGGAEQRLQARQPSANSGAYYSYLKGRFHWNKRSQDGLRQAETYFKEAVALDPLFAPAHAGLADTYLLLCNYIGEQPKQCYPKAKAEALEAIKLDPNIADPHATLAFGSYRYELDWAEAETAFRKALEISPNHSVAHQWYGEYLGLLGRHEESISELKQAQQLDPLSLIINTDLGAGYYVARQYDSAVTQLTKTIELEPNFSLAHLFLGMTYKHKGMFPEAEAELNQAVKLSGGRTVMLAALGNAYAASGKMSEARAALEQLKTRAKTENVPPFEIALVLIGLGENKEALDWLEKSSAARDYLSVYLKVDPNLDPLRSDKRFTALLQRMGFSQSAVRL